MRYKSVPRRTNHLASECHGSVTVAPTPSHLPASRHCARVNPSSLASLLALALLISSRLSVVLAVPSSRLPLHNKTIALADTLNRPTRSIDSSHRLIVGFKLEGDAKSIVDNGREYIVKANSDVQILLFATDFQDVETFQIGFSDESPPETVTGDDGGPCTIRSNTKVNASVLSRHTAEATISLAHHPEDLPYILCYLLPTTNNGTRDSLDGYTYAGRYDEAWYQIRAEAPLVPLWLQLVLIAILLTMSGLFSGLNLGLMALDKNELQVIGKCGTEEEKYWAKSIAPVRKKGNYLLCTLLLGNVLVNSTLTILMDDLASGVFAVITSTLAIVVFGEIIPQALCSRHGLAVGAKTIYITYLFMGLTFPLSYPISLILDKILGEEIGNVYDRDRLMEYIRVTKDYNHLEADEMDIISGALRFKDIRVADIMTPIDDVFMLPYETTLNFDTLTLINNSGYSRIPIYENDRDNVVGILHVKDLALIDTDHNLPLKVVLDFYSHPLFSVFEYVTLDVMLNEFKSGKSHMALVRRVINNGVNDPIYEVLGVVTLEDIIEELIQAEINDETDVVTDNRRKQKRKEVQSRPNYLNFIRDGFKESNEHEENDEHLAVSPQLALATSRFLASFVEPFRRDYLSEEVLKILMSKNIYFEARGQPRKENIADMQPENVLYVRGQPADYFIMILEGRARIIVTVENQEYDAGPFCVFGVKALTSAISNLAEGATQENADLANKEDNIDSECTTFTPDFTLLCLEKVVYMKITRKLYTTAIRTTKIEKQRTDSVSKLSAGPGTNNYDSVTSANSKTSRLLFARDRKASQYLMNVKNEYRRFSLSTNLPDSSFFLNQGDVNNNNNATEEK